MVKGTFTRANIPVGLFESLMLLAASMMPNENERVRTIVEVIADIKEPLEVCIDLYSDNAFFAIS